MAINLVLISCANGDRNNSHQELSQFSGKWKADAGGVGGYLIFKDESLRFYMIASDGECFESKFIKIKGYEEESNMLLSEDLGDLYLEKEGGKVIFGLLPSGGANIEYSKMSGDIPDRCKSS
ncbi:hypothetical protein [Salinibacter ruber]|uniref:hypothetical protein n=1 Tax=Salinibacter ruber TaxID=146919 RepID=UPI002168B63F|nr:hypothetical protein [Salinibacter ruber]